MLRVGTNLTSAAAWSSIVLCHMFSQLPLSHMINNIHRINATRVR